MRVLKEFPSYFKITIKDVQHLVEVQKELFDFGCKWVIGYQKIYKKSYVNVIYVSMSDLSMTFSSHTHSKSENLHTEITLEQFKLLVKKNKSMKLDCFYHKINDDFTAKICKDKISIGCKVFTENEILQLITAINNFKNR